MPTLTEVLPGKKKQEKVITNMKIHFFMERLSYITNIPNNSLMLAIIIYIIAAF